MKLKFSVAAFALLTLVSGGTSAANLLTNGDFETAAPTTVIEEFTIGSNLGTWISRSYLWTDGGPAGSSKFAQAPTGAGGGDFRLVQFIDASSITVGSSLTLEFDYIYGYALPRTDTTVPRYANLIGITLDRTYKMYAGEGVDGICSTSLAIATPPCPANQPDNEVLAPDVLLNSVQLARTETWALDQTLTATVGASYAYIGVVFQASCFDSVEANCSQFTRGFDNVSLTVTGQAPGVPEPGTLALLGLGLAGLAASRRRKQ